MTQEKEDKRLDLQAAYSVRTPAENEALYAAWAKTYDESFAAASDYIFPQQVARVFHEQGGHGPVLDAGAGTGLVAEAIAARKTCLMDAFDISEPMLSIAKAKGVYRRLVQGDLTQKLPFDDGSYASVVSAGTFTHGHVGPEAMDELLRVSASGALLVLTIKAELYEARGFAATFSDLGMQIYDFQLQEVPIYGAGAQSSDTLDAGLIACFRKT
ncbi:class I SAM-dependent methyltransferase [Roseobacter denitrificans]|uniref:Methyltransferase type 11 domain-containing protein n=1 Tax=Roseobacter denitrificans (strain ATCC 33942 / OCh 114) TaxID=375451 RepID=Q16CJ3_ROSDO|nr:class I SAM-dependent methyltransferase [Roseobacter denitrificans]ABG30300.1 conserved hypothetical protein [Roseobacter denitrificans OCh 114]AVL53473.1 class I SAM-dependent methyltransferase [Roseobacter denitrificans]SFF71344.1 Methyltransferase domain-containing protein [Roseobacter denitrificans OCh 114]